METYRRRFTNLTSKINVIVLQVSTIDDKKDYGVVNKAMKMIGFSDRERETVWKIVAAIIHLVCPFIIGCVKFVYTSCKLHCP